MELLKNPKLKQNINKKQRNYFSNFKFIHLIVRKSCLFIIYWLINLIKYTKFEKKIFFIFIDKNLNKKNYLYLQDALLLLLQQKCALKTMLPFYYHFRLQFCDKISGDLMISSVDRREGIELKVVQ